MKTKPVQLKQPEKKMSATKLIQILKAKKKTIYFTNIKICLLCGT